MKKKVKEEMLPDALLKVAHHDYEKALNLHSYFRLNDRALSNDLVQETFIKTWAYLAKGGKIDAMKAFLYHVLNNLIIDEYRKKKAVSLDLLLESGFEPQNKGGKSITDEIDDNAVIALMKRLPEKQQKIIRMRYVQDLSLEEMAILTKQSKNTVAVQVHRAVEKLKLVHEATLIAEKIAEAIPLKSPQSP
ncbi:MAG: sigma-70 family RNA polymerase sigma factor [bacterium]|nr:sigma-70 family RNA polymerase sigma factor [bacterium]